MTTTLTLTARDLVANNAVVIDGKHFEALPSLQPLIL